MKPPVPEPPNKGKAKRKGNRAERDEVREVKSVAGRDGWDEAGRRGAEMMRHKTERKRVRST